MRRERNKKSDHKIKAVICIITMVNFLLGIAIRVYDRKAIIRAVEKDGQVQTLCIAQKQTRKL